MTQAYYRKWRPQNWDQVIGQDHVIRGLRNAVAAGRTAHAYLFAGPRGTGKTTTARLLAKAINCLEEDLSARPCNSCECCLGVNQGRFLDLIEIDAASNTSVEDVRDLRDKINFTPNQGKYKVYIIDEVHMLSTAAFNALLKTLEEPPNHAIFILATTEVHKIPATVLSRCQLYEFRRIPVNDIIAHLKDIAKGEGIQAADEALKMLARHAMGSLRDAVSLLDQLSSTGKTITLEDAQSILGVAASQAVLNVVEAVVAGDSGAGLDHIHQALDAGSDPRQFARQIVEYLRGVLLTRMNNGKQVDAPVETRAVMARHAQAFTIPTLLAVIRTFNHAATDARLSWQPALPLELAFIDAVEKRSPDQAGGAHARTEPDIQRAAGHTAARKAPDIPAERSARREVLHQESEPQVEPASGQTEGDSGPTGLTMERINQDWRQVLSLVRQHNPQTQGLLNSCKPLGAKDGVLILGFTSDFPKAKIEKPEHMDIVRRVMIQVYGAEVPIHCIVSGGQRGTAPSDIDSDGIVATALRDLGGEIVDIQ
jgi:DNA polymerase III subunit gamma/tau